MAMPVLFSLQPLSACKARAVCHTPQHTLSNPTTTHQHTPHPITHTPTAPSKNSFAEASARQFGQRGMDRVRGTLIGQPDVSLKYFEEVFTSQHWMMRIYRVRDRPLRDATKPKSGRVRGALAAAAAA